MLNVFCSLSSITYHNKDHADLHVYFINCCFGVNVHRVQKKDTLEYFLY